MFGVLMYATPFNRLLIRLLPIQRRTRFSGFPHCKVLRLPLRPSREASLRPGTPDPSNHKNASVDGATVFSLFSLAVAARGEGVIRLCDCFRWSLSQTRSLQRTCLDGPQVLPHWYFQDQYRCSSQHRVQEAFETR